MENYNEYYDKAQTLMQNALMKYKKGDFEGGDKNREEANKYFDLAEKNINSDMYKTSMLYGENKNFGIIYKVIESNSKSLFETKNGRNKLKNIINLIKENKCLKQQFNIYNSFTNKANVSDSSKYVNEALSLCPTMSLATISKNNDKLIKLIRKSGLNEMVEIPEEELNLYSSIEYSISNKKSLKNLNNYITNENVIKDYIDKNKIEEKEIKNIDACIDEVVNKYDSLLNDDEINLIKDLSLNENKEETFNTYKNNLIKAINEEISKANEEDLNEWKNIHKKILDKKYNKSTFINDVAEMIEIENTINND